MAFKQRIVLLLFISTLITYLLIFENVRTLSQQQDKDNQYKATFENYIKHLTHNEINNQCWEKQSEVYSL